MLPFLHSNKVDELGSQIQPALHCLTLEPDVLQPDSIKRRCKIKILADLSGLSLSILSWTALCTSATYTLLVPCNNSYPNTSPIAMCLDKVLAGSFRQIVKTVLDSLRWLNYSSSHLCLYAHLQSCSSAAHQCTMSTPPQACCAAQVKETVRDVKLLHNEQFFAAAQKKYVYIYDKRGLEVHCLKVHCTTGCSAVVCQQGSLGFVCTYCGWSQCLEGNMSLLLHIFYM